MPTSTDGGGTTIVLGNGQGGNSGTDWTDWARLALGAYSALKKPSFSQQPMSPEQKRIYQIYLDNLMNPTYQKLGPEVVSRAQQMTDKLGQGSWTSPKTFSGDVGYQGTGGFGAGIGGLTPWSSATTGAKGQNLRAMGANGQSQAGSMKTDTGRLTPNIQQWDPASEFPMNARMAQTDPNKEVTLDPNHWITRPDPGNAGTPHQNADGSYSKGTLPPGMSYSPGELPGFIQFMRSSGMKDAAKIAVGFFSVGLAGVANAAAKAAWDHYQATKKGGG